MPDESDGVSETADGAGGDDTTSRSAVVRLQDSLRSAFAAPFGPIYTDTDELLAAADGPIIAVGDVVTAHLRRAGHEPAVVVIDGRTQRGDIEEWVADELPPETERTRVSNPAATLTAETLSALRAAVGGADGESSVIGVDGEEDLVTLAAIIVAPAGASVVYGQPGEGMVSVSVTDDARAEARRLLERMDGDPDRALELLGVE